MRQRNGSFRLEELEQRDVPAYIGPILIPPVATVSTPDHWHARPLRMPIEVVSFAQAATPQAAQPGGAAQAFAKLAFQGLTAAARIGPIIDT
jgi:hypothetical protein